MSYNVAYFDAFGVVGKFVSSASFPPSSPAPSTLPPLPSFSSPSLPSFSTPPLPLPSTNT